MTQGEEPRLLRSGCRIPGITGQRGGEDNGGERRSRDLMRTTFVKRVGRTTLSQPFRITLAVRQQIARILAFSDQVFTRHFGLG
jgi:hypothetical protein